MIYTSNYARKGSDPNAVAISRKPPDWFQGTWIKELAPTWDMVNNFKNGIITEEEYTTLYIKILNDSGFDPHEFMEALPDPAYLLCYEKPYDFCHRRILAEWIELKTGVHIPEWKNEKEQKEYEQSKLVDSMLDFE